MSTDQDKGGQPPHNKPDEKHKPGDVYGGTWAPPHAPPRQDSGAGSAPRAPKSKSPGEPQDEPKSFEKKAADPSDDETDPNASAEGPQRTAYWSPPLSDSF